MGVLGTQDAHHFFFVILGVLYRFRFSVFSFRLKEIVLSIS